MESEQNHAIKQYMQSIFIRADVTDEEIEEIERKQREESLYRNFTRTVPERYKKESLATFRAVTDEQKKLLEVTRRFIDCVNKRGFATLIFLGSVGTGKTHLASATIRECGGQYRTASAICAELRNAKSFTSKLTEEDVLDFYGNMKLLVIDEIGRGATASEEQYMLYQIINARYNTKRPTLLISNQNKKDFMNYIGIATSDRIVESGKIIELQGQSYRAKLRSAQ